MIAVCDNHHSPMGNRYDWKVAPRAAFRCGLCGGALRAQKKGDSIPNIINAVRVGQTRANTILLNRIKERVL